MRSEVTDVNPRTLVWSLLALFALLFTSCAAPVAPTLDLTPASQTLIAGQTRQLTVTRRVPGGSVEDVTSRVTFVIDPIGRSTANVSERGVVSAGTEPGTVIIKAYDSISDATAVASVTVIAPLITAIDVAPSVAVMARGATLSFTALARLNNGTTSDVTNEVLWSSTNTAAAIVGNTQFERGVVSAVAEGDTTILATDAKTGVVGRSTVFVTGSAPVLQAIVVTPNPAKVGIAMKQELSALGVYSDGSSKNLTTTVTWSSSRPDVATVDVAGVVTGVLMGDATITATGPEPSTTVKGSAAAKVVP